MLMSKDVFGLAVFATAIVALFLIPGAFDTLFALIFVGMIPFTSFVVPPLAMLIVYILLILLGVRWLATQPARMFDTNEQDRLAREKARKVVAKKTNNPATSTTKRRRYQHVTKQA